MNIFLQAPATLSVNRGDPDPEGNQVIDYFMLEVKFMKIYILD